MANSDDGSNEFNNEFERESAINALSSASQMLGQCEREIEKIVYEVDAVIGGSLQGFDIRAAEWANAATDMIKDAQHEIAQVEIPQVKRSV